MLSPFEKYLAGGILFLLPFFVFPYGGPDMELQFQAPKLWGAFFLGNVMFSFYLGRRIHVAMGVAHLGFSLSVLFTGFGAMQLYPYAYWVSGLFLSLWALSDLGPMERAREQGLFMILPSTREFLFRCIALGGILCALHAFVQTLGFVWPLHYADDIHQGTPIAFFGQHTKLGAFLAPVASICLALGWIPAACFVSFVCLLTGSSFTIGALFVGMTVALRFYTSRRFSCAVFLIAALVGGVGLYFKPNAEVFFGHGRSHAWADTIDGWRDAKLLGHGPGSFREMFHTQYQKPLTKMLGSGDYLQAHNDYLQVPFESGIFGSVAALLLLAGLAYAYYLTWWRGAAAFMPVSVRCAQAGLAATLANAAGNFPFQMSPGYLIAILCAAILLRASRA